ncbi:MAG: hypothetical protein PHY34_02295 [Patescibacteria group bacterium]|nr:hypothetical protein [Patescibacteria group bacterium]MDD5715235.1 hypothetical protein [Patescibacteria group bacterium]
MPQLSLSFGKLVLYDPSKSRSTCNIYVSRPSPVEEQNLGRLFLCTEINSRSGVNLDIVSAIQDELQLSYYGTDDLNIETAFEKALEQVNQKIADMVGDYDTNWLDKLNAVALLVRGTALHLSSIGTTYAFLIRNNRITNIVESATHDDQATQHVNPLKAFSNIISGTLEPDDSVLVCTSSVLDYLSQEKLKRTVSEQSAEQSMHSIETILTADETNSAFSALTIKLTPAPEATAEASQPVLAATHAAPLQSAAPYSSMDNLFQKQADTSNILSPSLMRYIRDVFQRTYFRVTDFIKLKVLRLSPRRVKMEQELRYYRPASQRTMSEPSTLGSFFSALLRGLRWLGRVVGAGFRAVLNLFRKRREIMEQVSATPAVASKKTASLIIAIKRLPRVSKIILAVAVVVAFLLAQSLYSSIQSNANEQEQVEFERLISDISQNISRAEADLSYGNEDGAREEIAQAQASIKTITDATDEFNGTIETYTRDITAQLEKLRHVVDILAPREVATVSSPDTPISASGLALLGNALYTIDPTSKTIFRADIATGTTASFRGESADGSLLYGIPVTNTAMLFLTTKNQLGEFSTTNEKFQTAAFTMPNPDVNIMGIGSYEGKLYLLDINGNQIYRSNKSGNAYSNPVEWLKDDTNLRNAASIAIDGYIYILSKDGSLTRLFRGARQEWALAPIDPALDKADAVWTNAEINNIYITDNNGKRIIEFTKDGKLVNQYTSPAFKDLRGVAVDQKTKKLYVLSDNTILEIDLIQ